MKKIQMNLKMSEYIVEKIRNEVEDKGIKGANIFVENILEKYFNRVNRIDLRREPHEVIKEYFNIDMPIIQSERGYILLKTEDNTKTELIRISESGKHFFEKVELLKYSTFQHEKIKMLEVELDIIPNDHNICIARGYYTVDGKESIKFLENTKYFSIYGYEYYLDQIALVNDYDSFKFLTKLIELPQPNTIRLPDGGDGYPHNWNLHLEEVFKYDMSEYLDKWVGKNGNIKPDKNDEKNYLRWDWFKKQSMRVEAGINKEEWEQAIKGNTEPLILKLRTEREECLETTQRLNEICDKEDRAEAKLKKAEQEFNEKMKKGEKISQGEIDYIMELTTKRDILRHELHEALIESGRIREIDYSQRENCGE